MKKTCEAFIKVCFCTLDINQNFTDLNFRKYSLPYDIKSDETTLAKRKLRTFFQNAETCPADLVLFSVREKKCYFH